MRTIFSCVLGALLIAACCAQTTSLKDTKTAGLFQQAINYLRLLIPKEKDRDIFLHSPTNDIKECCSQTALECFNKQLANTSNTNELKKKLVRNLSRPSMRNSVNTCTAKEIEQAQCMSCKSYPKVSSKDFLKNLQSHLQKAYSRLS